MSGSIRRRAAFAGGERPLAGGLLLHRPDPVPGFELVTIGDRETRGAARLEPRIEADAGGIARLRGTQGAGRETAVDLERRIVAVTVIAHAKQPTCIDRAVNVQ